jgi:tRNA-modifying protein YgfZ
VPGEPIDLQRVLGAVEVDREIVGVDGPDAVAYLQGQLSQDIEDLDVGATTWSFVLQPTGKVAAWLRVTRTSGDTYVLDTDAGTGDTVVNRLRQFLLRTKADIERLPWRCVALRGPGAVEAAAKADVAAELRVPAGWPGVEGACLLGPDVEIPDGIAEADIDSVQALRILAGVPAMGAEFTEKTIPAEAGQWLIDLSVDFTKGCFTGQELVARIDSRGGNVPRHLRGVVLGGTTDPPPAGAPVLVDGAEVGQVTSSAYAPSYGSAVALAFVGRAVEPPTEGVVAWDDAEVPAAILPLPLLG